MYPTIKVVFAVIRGMEWLMLSHHHGVLIIAIGTEMREGVWVLDSTILEGSNNHLYKWLS